MVVWIAYYLQQNLLIGVPSNLYLEGVRRRTLFAEGQQLNWEDGSDLLNSLAEILPVLALLYSRFVSNVVAPFQQVHDLIHFHFSSPL